MLALLASRPAPFGRVNAAMTLCDKITPQAEIQTLLQRIIEAPEEAPAAHLSLAACYWRLGLSMEAMANFNAVLEHESSTDEQASRASLKLGELLADELELPREAEAALVQSVALDPECHEGWSALGRLRYQLGALSDAAEALATAVAISPDEAAYRASLAQALRAQGEYAEARTQYSKAAELGEVELDQALSYYYVADGGGAAAEKEKEENDHDDHDDDHHHDESRAAGHGDQAGASPSAALAIPPSGLYVPSAWITRLSGVYMTDVASAAECEWVIAEAERCAAARSAQRGGTGGEAGAMRGDGSSWSSDGHHDRYQTRDIVVAESEALAGWLNRKLRDVIWPALAAQFAVREEELWLQDAFVVRYEPGGQRGLAPHLDDSELSFNIALSDPTSFGGGGTSFAAAAATLRPQRGQMVSHFGRVFHAGEPVTEGTRYILAGFVGARSLAREWRAAPASRAEGGAGGGGATRSERGAARDLR